MVLFSRYKLVGAAVAALMLTTALHASDPLRIKVKTGKLEGKQSADGQVRDFLGIPFAAPPVGPLRWKPPQPAPKWHGVRQATAFGSHCMQPQVYGDMIFRDPGASEDCLTLNVWTPAHDKHAKLPVMVWIYGGGFSAGGTSEARQDGEHLAHKGVIVVSMNYRLGIFGFFATHELAMESPRRAAGNYGLMDQVAAFEWVKKNIAAFGGDPKKVTIFGESAGSISVSAQMASPMAQGLFVRAIGESGGALGNIGASFSTLPVTEDHDEVFARDVLHKTDLAGLRGIPAAELMNAAWHAHSDGFHLFWPNIDGEFLPESPAAIYSAGRQAHVPLLAGWNKDEGTGQVLHGPLPTTQSMQQMASREFGPRAEVFLQVYAVTPDEDIVRVVEDYSGDRFIAYSTWAWLEAQVKTGGAPVFRYRFDLPSPGDAFHPATMGAFHSDDIEYVFGNLDSRKGAKWRPEDYKLSDLMQTYWTNFAKTGNPNGAGTANWPQYNAQDNWEVMHLSPEPAARPDRHRDRYLFLQQQQVAR